MLMQRSPQTAYTIIVPGDIPLQYPIPYCLPVMFTPIMYGIVAFVQSLSGKAVTALRCLLCCKTYYNSTIQ